MRTPSRVWTGLWRSPGKLLVVLSCATFFADMVHAAQWARTYGFSNDETATDIRATPDGGFVLSGSVGQYVTGVVLAAQALVIRLDAGGNIVWQRSYGGVGGDAFNAMRPTVDGGYIVAGYTTSFGSGDLDAWVLKLDSAGNVTWQMAYGGTRSDIANAVEPTPDGGYVVAGYTASYGTGGQDAWVLKLDANGDVIWQKAYGGRAEESANSIQATADGGYVVAGYTSSYGAGIADAWVLKLDAAGDILWQRTYGGGFHDEAKSIRQVADGGYVVAGHWGFNYLLGNSWYGEAWVLRLDAAGNLIWQTTRGGNGFDEANAVESTVDGGYVAVGNHVRGNGYAYEGPRAVLLKLDGNGHVVWQRAYSATAASVQVTPDGDNIIGGRSAPTGSSGAWALKADANGAVPDCAVMIEASWASSENTATVVDSTASATLTHAMPVDTTAIPGEIGLGFEEQCYYSPPASSANYQGLWWNAPPESESGWGINLAHQGDAIFATWYTYDLTGKAWWLSMTANRTAEATYTGTLLRTTGPAFSAAPFDPAKVTRAPIGTGTLTFSDADHGRFAYTVDGVQQAKVITRQVFGPLPNCAWNAQPDLAGAGNYQDLWWVANGAESGWGVNLAHQGDNIFATWFTYDTDGTPLWLSVTAAKTAPNVYRGQLNRTTGPAFNAVPFDPANVTRTVVGMTTFTFANGNAATFAYTLNGVSQTKTITRQLFAPPAGTVCGEPYRTPAPVTVVAAGDIAECGNAPAAASAAARTAALIGAQDAIVLTLGDNAYKNGTPAEFASCFQPTWGAFKDRIRPSPGNHDYNTRGAEGYFGYFGAQAGPDRRGYYSFDYGGWHFISLNSLVDVSLQSEQYLWLTADLATSRDSLCTIAYWHYPAFNSGAKHGSIEGMKPFFDALYTAGVEIVLSGHEHIYERFAPQRADGTADPARGVRQFVVGTGGAGLYPLGPPILTSEFRSNTTWGVLRLTLDQGSYSWRFVPVGGGDAIDSGNGTCHP